MKPVIKLALFASSLAFLNACGSSAVEERKEESQVQSLTFSNLDFNLGSYLQKKYADEKKSFPKLISADSSGLSAGGQKSFKLTTNIIYKSQEQKVNAQYYVDAIALEKPVIGGRLVDVGMRAQTDTPEAEYFFRVAGKSLAGQKTSSVKTFHYTREVGVTLPWDGVVPGLGLDLGGKVGFEGSLTLAPNINVRLKTAELIVTPSIGFYGNVDTGISVLFAKAGARGTVQILRGMMPVTGGISLLAQPKPILRVEPLKLQFVSGGADLYASLSIGNILPGPARSLWEMVFGKPLEYTYPLIRWDGFDVIATKGYDLAAQK